VRRARFDVEQDEVSVLEQVVAGAGAEEAGGVHVGNPICVDAPWVTMIKPSGAANASAAKFATFG
jgi:hypothetical protein